MSAQSSQWFGVNGRSSAVLKTINGQAALLGPGKFAGMMVSQPIVSVAIMQTQ
jgi:hypothetical protein